MQQPRPIRKLSNLCLRTDLRQAVILIPHSPAQEAAAREIRRRVGPLPVHYDIEASRHFLEHHHVIALGNLCTNKFVERLYYQWYTNVDCGYPGEGGYVVRSIHNPWGTGKNVILLGGSTDAGIESATQAFLRSFRPLSVGWLGIVKLGRGLREEMEAKPHYRGPICDGGFKYYFSGEEKYGRIYRKALLDRTRMDDPFETSHIWFWEPLALWDLLEESPIFSNRDRLIITNLFLQWVESHEGRNFAGFRQDLRLGNLSQPHRTSPALACFFGGRYFKKYYGLKQTRAWFADARKYFAPQTISSKTIDEPEGCTADSLGCGGMMTYAFASGDMTCFENGTVREAADRVAMCCNNLGVMAAYADTQSFSSVQADFFCRAAHYYKDGAYEFMARMKNPWRSDCKPVWRDFDHPTPAFHTDVEPREPKHLLGVKVAPLSKMYWDKYRGNYTFPDFPKTIPHRKSFDKISFRSGFRPEDDYLLLDGVSGGVHGYADANSILEYTSRGRLWIVTADLSYGYDNSGISHHNAVSVLRDGGGELPPGFAALEELRPSFTHTALPNYNGVDWHRKITWSEGRHFLVVDELRIRKDGQYRFDCRWRTLGEPMLKGNTLVVDQKGVQLHIENSGAHRLNLERDEGRGSYFSCWAKKRYEFAKPILNILTQTIQGRYQRGDVVRFTNLIRISARRSEFKLRLASSHGMRGTLKRELSTSPKPIWSFATESGIRDIQVSKEQIVAADSSGLVVRLDHSGRRLWQRRVGFPVNSIAFGDINGDGASEIIAGADGGWVYALDLGGKLLWKHQLPALDAGNIWGLPTPRVMRVRCADLDGDGRDEIVAGVGNLHLQVLAGDGRSIRTCLDWARTGLRKFPSSGGRELWRRFSWGIWNRFDFCDLNGDGKLEIIGGPGMPPKAAGSPAWILRHDGEVLAELDIDGWAGGLNALVVGDGGNYLALGTMKGFVRVFEPPKRLGRRIPLKRGEVVLDHTSGMNRNFKLEPPRLLWERNLGDLVTGLVSIEGNLVASSNTGYVSAFNMRGGKPWVTNMGEEVTSLLALSTRIAVACKSGEVCMLDPGGEITDRVSPGNPILKLESAPGDKLLVATCDRTLCLWDTRP